ncbi:MAG: amidohydrolase family protein [Rhodothermaceae bacterium]|nr:amidohydrolase family protein [Rhodothermaceae bacterium]MYF63622.1 amidohydrolase family protein [Rhodothermaceae bacterium]MYI84890.1 amidohydrolase family protein [Rhodothermaceae bacterium]
MKLTRNLLRRSLSGISVGIVVFVGIILTLPVPSTLLSPTEDVPQESFAVVDVTVFDGEVFRERWDVWIESGQVRQVGQNLDLPDNLPRLDGRAHTLIPGLIDAHVHTFGTTLNDALRFGVTTVLDQFTDPALVAPKRAARQEIGIGTEADIFSAGMLATAPGGYGSQFGVPVQTISGPSEATEWVRARKSEGSDWIKIVLENGGPHGQKIPSLSLETAAALVEAAHTEGLAAVVHASTLNHALEAMAMRVDGLVHIWQDEVITSADAQRLAEADIFVVPTLSGIISYEDSAVVELIQGTDDSMLSPMQEQTLANRFPSTFQGDVAIENVRRLRAAGVRLLAGTDSPNPGTAAGISMHGEIRLLTRAGLRPAEALAAGTSIAADAFGIPDRGRIVEGSLADLVLVRGDVQANVTYSHDIVAVWKDGFLVNRGLAATSTEPVPAPTETLIADFEGGLEAAFGTWQITTDQMRGGASIASMTVQNAVLVIDGEISSNSAFPWAGVMWIPGAQPMDFSGREVIRFRTRGDGRSYSVMLFGNAQFFGAPPSVTFMAPTEWKQIEIPLEDFPTNSPEIITGIAFMAEGAAGPFSFEIDEVELK